VDQAGDPLPAGAVARLGTVRFRHEAFFMHGRRIAFMPDRKTIVSVESPSVIRFWEAATGRVLREVHTGELSIRGFALSPDGTRIAVGGFLPFQKDEPTPGAVRVLDAATGKEVRTWARKDDDTDPCALAFTPDSRLLLSLGGRSGILRVEEIVSGTELLRQRFPGTGTVALALSPDGTTLAALSGCLYIWRWQSGEEPLERKEPRRAGRGLCFSPDGKLLAELSGTTAVLLWDVAAGRLLRKLEPGEDTALRYDVAFTPDGKVAAATRPRRAWDGTVHFWDPATGRQLRRLEARGIELYGLAISADGRLLAAQTQHALRVWDLASGKPMDTDAEAHRDHVGGIATRVGGLVATASDDGTVRVWDAGSGRQRFCLDHGQWVRGVALSPDGKRLGSSGVGDDAVRLWDLETGREIYRVAGHGEHGGRRVVTFTPDGRRLLSWGDDFYLRVWDARTAKALREYHTLPTGIKIPEEDTELARNQRMTLGAHAAFSADGKVMALAVANRASVFDTDTGKEILAFETAQCMPHSAAISPDGRRLLLAGWGAQVETKLTDGATRVTIAEENPLELWDLTQGKRLRKVLLPGMFAGPAAFSADGATFAVAVEKPRPAVRLWEAATGAEKPAIAVPVRASALAFTPEGRHLITALDDTTALVWELKK
jgi:WD40 repeat protein